MRYADLNEADKISRRDFLKKGAAAVATPALGKIKTKPKDLKLEELCLLLDVDGDGAYFVPYDLVDSLSDLLLSDAAPMNEPISIFDLNKQFPDFMKMLEDAGPNDTKQEEYNNGSITLEIYYINEDDTKKILDAFNAYNDIIQKSDIDNVTIDSDDEYNRILPTTKELSDKLKRFEKSRDEFLRGQNIEKNAYILRSMGNPTVPYGPNLQMKNKYKDLAKQVGSKRLSKLAGKGAVQIQRDKIDYEIGNHFKRQEMLKRQEMPNVDDILGSLRNRFVLTSNDLTDIPFITEVKKYITTQLNRANTITSAFNMPIGNVIKLMKKPNIGRLLDLPIDEILQIAQQIEQEMQMEPEKEPVPVKRTETESMRHMLNRLSE